MLALFYENGEKLSRGTKGAVAAHAPLVVYCCLCCFYLCLAPRPPCCYTQARITLKRTCHSPLTPTPGMLSPMCCGSTRYSNITFITAFTTTPHPSPLFSLLSSLFSLEPCQPVGSGYSYSSGLDPGVQTEAEMAEDMYIFFQTFFQQHSKYQRLDFYIFGESYAGVRQAGIGCGVDSLCRHQCSSSNRPLTTLFAQATMCQHSHTVC